MVSNVTSSFKKVHKNWTSANKQTTIINITMGHAKMCISRNVAKLTMHHSYKSDFNKGMGKILKASEATFDGLGVKDSSNPLTKNAMCGCKRRFCFFFMAYKDGCHHR